MSDSRVEELHKRIFSCTKCSEIGIIRDASSGIVPIFGDGNPLDKPIWIIGLNPKMNDGSLLNPEFTSSFDDYQEHLY